LEYDKEDYKWCLGFKEMMEHCTASAGSSNWAEEEMRAYLDWSNGA